MAQQALPSGMIVPRRRALFGLLDADGWAWAGLKAAVWLVIIILLLGYIPDRAYYFTVNRTIDLGVLAWSPVNFCSNENEALPCPAPRGAVTAWHLSPEKLMVLVVGDQKEIDVGDGKHAIALAALAPGGRVVTLPLL